jgi:hypothetical protein
MISVRVALIFATSARARADDASMSLCGSARRGWVGMRRVRRRLMTGGGKPRRTLLLLIILVTIHKIAWGVRALIGRPPVQTPARVSSRPRHYLRRGLVAVLLASTVIVVIDWLGSAANDQVAALNKHWWGAAQESPWMTAGKHGITFLARRLTITINGDELTAMYEATAAADSPVTSTAESDTDAEAGDDLVDNVLGQVLVGEFHYGITGHQIHAYAHF